MPCSTHTIPITPFFAMTRLFVLLLQLLLYTPLSTSRDFNTVFYGTDGRTYIVSVNKRIDPATKRKLAKLDGAAAYNQFMEVYGAYLSNPRLLSTVDGDTRSRRVKKNKKNFMASLREVKKHNRKKRNRKYELTMNTFSVLDHEEKSQYLGAGNLSSITERETPEGLEPCRNRKTETECETIKLKQQCNDLPGGEQCELTCGRCGDFKLPETLDWNARGYVTQVKDQRSCGSCWTFSAVGVLEWIYKKTTGKLMQLSEQELLDCTYDKDGDNGCYGGEPWDAWNYVATYGRLASNKRYPYANADTDCFIDNRESMNRQFGNAIAGKFSVGRSVRLPPNLDQLVTEAVNVMALVVGLYVNPDTNSGFYQLGDGIWDDCPTYKQGNHIVTLVGYGPDYWEIKNSWGPDWGRNGFGRLLRGNGVNMCGILDNVAYVEYTDLDNSDGEPDYPREAMVDEDNVVVCEDNPIYSGTGYCPYWATVQNFCTEGTYVEWMAENCQKSCKHCRTVSRCDPGHYLAPGTSRNCQICPANSHNNNPRAESCTPCSAGSWSLSGSTSAEDCTECQPGTHLDPTTNRCVTCPADTYSSYGATACTECPEGSRSVEGSSGDSDCIIPPGDCVDALPEEKCQEFEENGGCVGGEHLTTARWGCKKTCAFCQEVEVCVNHDSDENCDSWAEEGYCTDSRYSDWMAANCTKSCDQCTEEDLECLDHESDCAVWASFGYCSESSIYHEYMKGHCRQSCNFCTSHCEYDADTHQLCGGWKEQGYCNSEQYLDFMRNSCSTACQLCPVKSTDGTAPVCKADQDAQSCLSWAKAGYCSGTYRNYMSTHCSTSCGFECAGSCRDNNAYCASWAQLGYCSSYAYYMSINCKSSCSMCYENSVSEVSGLPDCQDRNEYCPTWAHQGFCTTQTNRAWMAENCAFSCNTCTTKDCADIGEHCKDWAASGECTNNPAYMLENCKASCKVCGGTQSSRSAHYACADSDSRCSTWRAQGYCYYSNYSQLCRQSCGLC